MGMSFCTADQVKALPGCDRLTIATELLNALSKDESQVGRKLFESTAILSGDDALDESSFRWSTNQNARATENRPKVSKTSSMAM